MMRLEADRSWVKSRAARGLALALGVAAATARSSDAEAAEPATEGPCPPGAFCASPEPDEGAPADGPATEPTRRDAGAVTVVLPAPPEDRMRTVVVRQRSGEAPEIVSYETEAMAESASESAGETTRPATPAPDVRTANGGANGDTTWGLQLRGAGSLLPRRRLDAETPSMGGAGVGIRYRPVSPLALDVGLDLLMGIDSNGFQRREVPLAMSLLLYLLPDTVVQPYVFFGVSATSAEVDKVRPTRTKLTPGSDSYGYIGGHAGLGLDLRVASALSIGFDGFGYVRERVDQSAKDSPEFRDPKTGQASNTTVAGQLRGGVTFWW